ncbi:peroxisome biogenesis factor 10 [Kappamyces sp. JEL0829]|nr:peroxisome biogenesis factor 10 [Kappamyces sp. JEL0829]
MFPYAPAPDILRSVQKDHHYLLDCRSSVFDIVTGWFGTRTKLKYSQQLKFLSDFLYYGTSNLFGARQTVGEEYSDITAVFQQAPPSWTRRCVFILVAIVSPWTVKRIFQWMKSKAISAEHPEQRLSVIERTESFVLGPLFSMHLALFYFTGAYYHLSRRFFGLRYMLVRKLRKGEDEGGYELLGIMILIQLAARQLTRKHALETQDFDDSTYAAEQNPYRAAETAGSPESKCTLCLEPRKYSTAASCGHVYCWKCICDWIRTKPECALCRQPIAANTLVPLVNY